MAMSSESDPRSPASGAEESNQEARIAMSTVKHPSYFFDDGSLKFTIKNVKYSIHSSLLQRHAPDWLAKLDEEPQPIVLKDVSTAEMDALLSIMYPSDVCRRDISSVENWTAVLRLSTRWNFPSFRKLALMKLEPLASPIEKLILARELSVPDWLEPSIAHLCLRPDPLTLAEAELLDLADTVMIFTIHERVQTNKVAARMDAVRDHIRWLTGQHSPPTSNADITPDSPPIVQDSPVIAELTLVNETSDAIFNAESLNDLLRRGEFSQAVQSMSENHRDNIVQALVKWTTESAPAMYTCSETTVHKQTTPACRCTDIIRDVEPLVVEFVRRSAHDSSFIPAASTILSQWYDAASVGAYSIKRTLRLASKTILCRPESAQSAQGSTSSLGQTTPPWDAKYICPPSETVSDLSEEEYTRRSMAATDFIAASVGVDLIPTTLILENLPQGLSKISTLHDVLSKLGPVIDASTGGRQGLDDHLDELQRYLFMPEPSPTSLKMLPFSSVDFTRTRAQRVWVQILCLRERNWVAI